MFQIYYLLQQLVIAIMSTRIISCKILSLLVGQPTLAYVSFSCFACFASCISFLCKLTRMILYTENNSNNKRTTKTIRNLTFPISHIFFAFSGKLVGQTPSSLHCFAATLFSTTGPYYLFKAFLGAEVPEPSLYLLRFLLYKTFPQ